MLEKVLQAILRKYFGQYLTGLESVELAFWTGKIHIQSASLKHDKINELVKRNNLPLSIKYSHIGSLSIDIPWKQLSSAPVQVIISDIFIVLKLENFNPIQSEASQNSKILLIKNYVEYLIKKSVEANVQNQGGYFNNLVLKILHNMNITVKNISFRIQNQGFNREAHVQKQSVQQQKNIMENNMEGERRISQKSNSSQHSKERRRSSASKLYDKTFALGFCIKTFQAFTIDEHGTKKFVNIENEQTKISKNIQLSQISLYWQQSIKQNLYRKNLEAKNQFMKNLIDRKQHRLLTIDGTALLQKNRNINSTNFSYFLSSTIKQLLIESNYEQLKEMIQVYNKFQAQSQKKSIIKLKQLPSQQQMKLQSKFKQKFKKLYKTNFKAQDQKQTTQVVDIVNCIDKKLLLKWSKQETIQILKKQKMDSKFKQKNRKGWFGFLSKQAEIPLDEQDIKLIEEDIERIFSLSQEKYKNKKTYMVDLVFEDITLLISQKSKTEKEKIVAFIRGTHVQYQKAAKGQKLELKIEDIGVKYNNQTDGKTVNIVENQSTSKLSQIVQDYQFLTVKWQSNDSNNQKIFVNIEPVVFNHEIKVLGFIKQLLKLKQNDQLRSNMIILKNQVEMSLPQEQIQLNNISYQINIRVSKIQFVIQINEQSVLNMYIQSISVQTYQKNRHKATVQNFCIKYIKKYTKSLRNSQLDSNPILNNICLELNLNGLQKIGCVMPKLDILLCQQDLQQIYQCLNNQVKMLSLQKKQNKNQNIKEEIYLQGKLKILNSFKVYKIYLAVLCSDTLLLYSVTKNVNNLKELLQKNKQVKPSFEIPITNIRITKISKFQLKLESNLVNQILQLATQQETDQWKQILQRRVFESRAKASLYDLIDQFDQNNNEKKQQKKVFYKYDTQIQLNIQEISILYIRNYSLKLLQLTIKKLSLNMNENNFEFQRIISLDYIQLRNCQAPLNNFFGKIVTNYKNYENQIIENNSISVCIQGKKKLHPKYTGQLQINIKINSITVNFDAEIIYMLIQKIAWQKKHIVHSQQRKIRILLEILKEYLQNQEIKELDQKVENSNQLEETQNYIDIDQYKKYFTCLVLMHLGVIANQVNVNLMNGRTHFVLFNAKIKEAKVDFDKGNNFMFVKVKVKQFQLKDSTNYPQTITQQWCQTQNPYSLISTQPNVSRTKEYAAQCYFSSFSVQNFINKQRFKSFFTLNVHDLSINYQHQPLMRFVDYLTNQLIIFFMEPHSLHRFDPTIRGQFKIDGFYFRLDEIQEYIMSIVRPFFNLMMIKAQNLIAFFNTFPNQEAIKFNFPLISLQTYNFLCPQRIQLNTSKLIQWQKKYQQFNQISLMSQFQEKIVRNQWANKMFIKAQNISSEIIENQFNFSMFFQRALHSQKQMMFPFVQIKKDFICQGNIKHLTIQAPKNIYNLINKCFMYNLSYDDGLDHQFNTNHQFRQRTPINIMEFVVKVNELSILIPQINETVVVIQEMAYRFLRYPDLTKEMGVDGKALHILGKQSNFIIPISFSQNKGLQYVIQMKPSGQKSMTTFFRQVDITYNLPLFNKLLQYFILSDDCYPPQKQFPDIPLISCYFYILDSHIRIAQTQQFIYSLNGDITFIWIRNKQIHSEIYKRDPSLFPTGKQGSSYIAKLKQCNFRKYSRKNYQNSKLTNYRVLSTPLNLDMNWSNIMKRAANGQTYSDFLVQYGIKNIFLKLSYLDIEDIKTAFVSKQQNQQQSPPPLPYIQYAKHIFNIDKFTIQLGISQLPVPLLDFNYEGMINMQKIGQITSIGIQMKIFSSSYWNMLIGRWEPILQKMSATANVKLSKQGNYVVFDSNKSILLNISLDSLNVINLISSDFSNQGKLQLIQKQSQAKGQNISPYVITNRTSLPLYLSNPIIVPARLKNNQKIHLQTKSLESIDQNLGFINFQFEGDDGKQYEIDLNISSMAKVKISYMDIIHELYLRPISNSIVKQIIITSPYVLFNNTYYDLIIIIHGKQYHMKPQQKMALPFYEKIDQKQFKLQFPHLKNVVQNYPFEYKDIVNGYEHYIVMDGNYQFNCTLTIDRQGKDGQHYITVQPVYFFKNLLPLDISIEFKNRGKLFSEQIEVNQQKEMYDLSSVDDVYLRLKVKGYNFSEFSALSKSQNPHYMMQEINIHDHRAISGMIKVKVIKQGKLKKVFLYVEGVFINQTDYTIYAFNQGKLLAGQHIKGIGESQTKYTFLQSEQNRYLNFGFHEEQPYSSNQFNSNQLGNHDVQMNKIDQLYQFTVNNSLHCLDEKAEIYCNILKAQPKYVIVNQCSRMIELKQHNVQKVFFLMPSQRKNWIWPNKNQSLFICVRAIDNQQQMQFNQWSFSAPLNLQILQDTVIVLRPIKNKKAKLLLKIQIVKENQHIFIIFKEIFSMQKQNISNITEEFYTVQNELKLVKLKVYQQVLQKIATQDEESAIQKAFQVEPNQSISIGWDYPHENHKLAIQMNFVGPLKSKFIKQSVVIDFCGNSQESFLIQNQEGDQLQIQFIIQTIGIKKRLKIRQKNQSQAADDLMMTLNGNRLGLSLSEIGISIINGGKNRMEVMYLNIKKFQTILMEENQVRKIQVRVKYISIDNNSNHNTIYPVFFTPLKHEKTMNKSRPFFVLLLEQNLKKKSFTQIKQFRMCLEPVSLKIHDQVLVRLYDMYKEYLDLNKKTTEIDLNKIFRSYYKRNEWQDTQLNRAQSEIFFKQFQIARLSIEISFSISPKINKGNYIIFTILSSFGLAISNVSESQLTLSRFFRKEATLTQIKNQLSDFYVKQFVKGIYKVLGSINLFGNPYVFIKFLAEGTWEIVNQPTQGFIKGPIQGSVGIVKGGVYFTRNVVAGTFNSFQAISQTFSRGVSYLSLDQKFIERRQKIKVQKSNHVFQGLANGLFSVYTGFQVAMTGLVRLPAEGYSKDGIKGGIIGTLAGLTGLVTKPISGIFGGVSKLSEGIKNTALLFQDGPNTKRARPPRVFLSEQQYYSNYNHLQSYTISFLEHLSTKYLNVEILFISVTEQIQNDSIKSLVLTQKWLIFADLVEKKIENQISVGQIQSVEIDNDTITIETKHKGDIVIEDDPQKCQQIYQVFKKLMDF